MVLMQRKVKMSHLFVRSIIDIALLKKRKLRFYEKIHGRASTFFHPQMPGYEWAERCSDENRGQSPVF